MRPAIMETGRAAYLPELSQQLYHVTHANSGQLPRDRYQIILQNMGASHAGAGSGQLVLNDAAITTMNSWANVRSYRTFKVPPARTLVIEGNLLMLGTGTNSETEFGLMHALNQSEPVNGVYFSLDVNNKINCKIRFNGGTLMSVPYLPDPPDQPANPAGKLSERWVIEVNERQVTFQIGNRNPLTLEPDGVTFATMLNNCALNVMARVYVVGVAASAGRQIFLTSLSVHTRGLHKKHTPPHAMCGGGQGAYQTQPNTGLASGQTANWANSAALTPVTLANNSAGFTGLGGIFSFAAVAAADTDYHLMSYQNPALNNEVEGYNLFVTGIRIGEMVALGAAVASGTMFQWAAGVNGTSLDLSLADASAATGTTIGYRRVPLGNQGIAPNPIGTQAPGFQVDFSHSPLVINPGQRLAIILKQPAGAATPSLVWRGSIGVYGYFDH